MHLYVIRHGETRTNREGRWTGWLDVPLTEKGRHDALYARRVLEGISFDKVYASDLIRAQETAAIALPGCQPELSELLRENNVGEFTDKPFTILTPEMDDYVLTYGYAAQGGESNDEFSARVAKFLRTVEERDMDCKNVAIFTHGGVMHVILETLVGMRLPRKKFSCANCTVAAFESRPHGWRLCKWDVPLED